MEADEDDALAQDRAEIILDLVQERGGLIEATVRNAVRTPVKVQISDEPHSMAAAPMTPTRKASFVYKGGESPERVVPDVAVKVDTKEEVLPKKLDGQTEEVSSSDLRAMLMEFL